ncbi:hypothetical protein WJ24_10670 [Burkholderia vietnamiensis]|uniref:DUF1488 domain-containing protein n=1 Tax=Burkholderia vietnamiensis TaxID=60552 RepID=UPI00075B2641|nr:DUF1488 domain-containing protein [Burkholderia vietnamiensis]KVG10925.1 hypothetical protein WJ24_10670 [Burkholderia vietnamiensis]
MASSERRVTLTDAPPEFDGAALQLRFVIDVDGKPQTAAITAEALEDHFGARSALEADLRDAFERGRARIQAACAELLANGEGVVELHSGYFRVRETAVGEAARAGLERARRS